MRYLIILTWLFLFNCNAFCDVIIVGNRMVGVNVYFTGLGQFPEVVLIQTGNTMNGKIFSPQIVKESEAINKNHNYHICTIFATTKKHVSEINLSSLDVWNDNQLIPATENIYTGFQKVESNNPTASIELYYRIVGFTETNLVIFMWKKIISYSNGQDDLTELYSYQDDTTSFTKDILQLVQANNTDDIRVYFNPVLNNISFQSKNLYTGNIDILILTLNGEKIKAQTLNFGQNKNQSLSTVDILPGIYIIEIINGNRRQTKKIIIA
jgi:hypothetical protein